MADEYDDAWHFAQFHAGSPSGMAVVQYELTSRALVTLAGIGMTAEPIPPANRFTPRGNQLVIPPNAFFVFNQLKNSGEITPSLHPDFRP